jgi:hypothetical protein
LFFRARRRERIRDRDLGVRAVHVCSLRRPKPSFTCTTLGSTTLGSTTLRP